jgi:hypothetical protein
MKLFMKGERQTETDRNREREREGERGREGREKKAIFIHGSGT